MTGSIRQRGRAVGSCACTAAQTRRPGQRRWHTRTVRGSRTEAQRALADTSAVANVAPAVGARSTLTDLLERWYAANVPNWAPTTVRNTRSIIDRHLTPGFGHVLVRDLTTVTIDEFYADLRTTGRCDGEPLSIGTVRRFHGVLHRALAQALRWEWIWHHPASTATPPTSQPVEMRPPGPGDRLLRLAAIVFDGEHSEIADGMAVEPPRRRDPTVARYDAPTGFIGPGAVRPEAWVNWSGA